ncbi:MAG TPA: hypothetical protein VLF91_01485 [Candidatus Saccharimonadales bacterium]|nr:hypothetical protein [Candidatus Saccharimonadales bacterium]
MRYFLGFLAAVGLIIVVFILLLRGFTHHAAAPTNQITLSDYANSQTVVQISVDGPINANQNHVGYQITVGRDSASLQVFSGYQGTVTTQKTYPNNQAAYDSFLKALSVYSFTKGNADSKLADERGTCPLGDRYTYSIVSGGQNVQRYWGTSCGGGTFQGKGIQVRELFIKQIPDFSQLTKGLIL